MEKCIKRERRKKEASPEWNQIRNRHHLSLNREETFAGLGQFLAGFTERLGLWTYEFVLHHWLGIVNFHILIFLLGALEAPLLLYLDQKWISRIIYGFYGFFCHQNPSRSFFLFDNQIAICSRCIAFYSAILISGLWVSIKKTKPLELKPALLLALPAIADVFLQLAHIQESTNLVRATTGSLLGVAIALYLFPRGQKALKGLTGKAT
jgi:uncharacterized membrane protein